MMVNPLHTQLRQTWHPRLRKVSKVVNFFAWGCLIVGIIFSAINVIGNINNINQVMGYGGFPELEYNTLIIEAVLSGLLHLFLGIIEWFLLKGAHLGLTMILETDLTYRIKGQTND